MFEESSAAGGRVRQVSVHRPFLHCAERTRPLGFLFAARILAISALHPGLAAAPSIRQLLFGAFGPGRASFLMQI